MRRSSLSAIPRKKETTISQWNFQAEPEALTILYNPVTFLRTKSLISFPVELGSPITGSPSNLLDENNDEAVLS